MAGGLERTIQGWRREKLGIFVMSLIVDDPEGERATVEAARTWREKFGLRSAFVAADPTSQMVKGRFGTPRLTIVDPRTMRIVDHIRGWPGRHPEALLDLARKNQTNR